MSNTKYRNSGYASEKIILFYSYYCVKVMELLLRVHKAKYSCFKVISFASQNVDLKYKVV